MARRELLPSYLSQKAWQDLCDAIDIVFASRIDEPANNLGKIRRTHLISYSGIQKSEEGSLLSSDTDLDVFEPEVLLKQVNSCGLIITSQGYFTSRDLSRLFRNLPKYWYSKGKSSVADFLSYVFNMPITFKRMWTEDYIDFIQEGEPGIGTPIYNGGTWYPTTHVGIEVIGFSLPGNIPLEIFAKLIEELINYPMVPVYIMTMPELFVTSNLGNFVPLYLGYVEKEIQVLANFVLTSDDKNSSREGGGFEAIQAVAFPGPFGTGYSDPAAPTANFTVSSSPTSGSPVTFTSTSTGHFVGQYWYFDSPSSPVSFETSFTNTYLIPGTYKMNLFVFNHAGGSLKTITFTVS